jgi:HSP20 family protein
MSRSLVPHNFFTGFDDFFATPFMNDDDFMPSSFLVPRAPEFNPVLLRSSPRYEITEDDTKFQIAIDLPGVKATAVDVNVKHGGRILCITGGRKVVKDNEVSETKFSQSFTIDKNVNTEKITANLADGVLVVSAPKEEKKDDTRTISITQEPHAIEEMKEE